MEGSFSAIFPTGSGGLTPPFHGIGVLGRLILGHGVEVKDARTGGGPKRTDAVVRTGEPGPMRVERLHDRERDVVTAIGAVGVSAWNQEQRRRVGNDDATNVFRLADRRRGRLLFNLEAQTPKLGYLARQPWSAVFALSTIGRTLSCGTLLSESLHHVSCPPNRSQRSTLTRRRPGPSSSHGSVTSSTRTRERPRPSDTVTKACDRGSAAGRAAGASPSTIPGDDPNATRPPPSELTLLLSAARIAPRCVPRHDGGRFGPARVLPRGTARRRAHRASLPRQRRDRVRLRTRGRRGRDFISGSTSFLPSTGATAHRREALLSGR